MRFPNLKSAIPASIAYGTFKGLLHRLFRINSDFKDFVNEALDLASIFSVQGCTRKKLFKGFGTFISETKSFPWEIKRKYMISRFKRLLKDLPPL